MRLIRKYTLGSFLFLSILLISNSAQSAVINVNEFDDEMNNDGDCSLREAVEAANTDLEVDDCAAGSGEDQINLPPGEYTLSISIANEDGNQTGDLDILSNISFVGSGADITTIDANGLGDRIFNVVFGELEVSISGLTMTGGDVTDAVFQEGGAIQALGSLSLNEVHITNNRAEDGGGIFIRNGTGEIFNSTISNNTATNRGGGIQAADYTLDLNNTTITGNQALNGGGLGAFDARYNFFSSTIAFNEATQDGGGLFVEENSAGSIANSILAGNSAGTPQPDCKEAVGVSFQFSNLTFNIFGDLVDCEDETSEVDQIIIDPSDLNLGSLADNGGPTPTLALLSDSPAIDRGNPAGCIDSTSSILDTDQRGEPREVDGNEDGTAICDVGAFEFIPAEEQSGGCSLSPSGNLPSYQAGLLITLALISLVGWRRIVSR